MTNMKRRCGDTNLTCTDTSLIDKYFAAGVLLYSLDRSDSDDKDQYRSKMSQALGIDDDSQN